MFSAGKNTTTELKYFLRKVFPFRRIKECTNMSNSNNRINVPQAKQAMEQFKMQAAQEEDVSSTS